MSMKHKDNLMCHSRC